MTLEYLKLRYMYKLKSEKAFTLTEKNHRPN